MRVRSAAVSRYLNVWTPAQEEGEQEELTYPVMVFIHGGGYSYGGACNPRTHSARSCLRCSI